MRGSAASDGIPLPQGGSDDKDDANFSVCNHSLTRDDDRLPFKLCLRLGYGAVLLGKVKPGFVSCSVDSVLKDMAQAGLKYSQVVSCIQVTF